MRITAAAQAANIVKKANHSILIYGPPKTGKSRLVGTAAKIDKIKRIFWIDVENGSEVLLNMGLTDSELSKIVLFKIPDTRDNPRAIETVLRMMTSKAPVTVCDEHGIVNCEICSKANKPMEKFFLRGCTHDDLVVIDSGSQLGISALNATCLGKGDLYKPQHDDWGNVGKWLSDILLIVQQAQFTNMVVITHELSTEGEDGVERIYPLMGTKAFSANVGRYFGTVAYTLTKLGKHSAASSSTYKPNIVTGSRVNVRMEDSKELCMADLLIKGGVL